MKLVSLFAILMLITGIQNSCSPENEMKKLEFLIGTWKVENKDTFERWEKKSQTEFIGASFKMKEDQKRVTETLMLRIEDGAVVYSATVPDQNAGVTILFPLNTDVKDRLSFENLQHDFPKKIQYKMITQDKIFVNVLGKHDEGFSFYLERQ